MNTMQKMRIEFRERHLNEMKEPVKYNYEKSVRQDLCEIVEKYIVYEGKVNIFDCGLDETAMMLCEFYRDAVIQEFVDANEINDRFRYSGMFEDERWYCSNTVCENMSLCKTACDYCADNYALKFPNDPVQEDALIRRYLADRELEKAFWAVCYMRGDC